MRHLFGGSTSDYAMERVGSQLLVRPGATGTIWGEASGGVQITDLTDLSGTPITTITADADGAVAFFGPDDVTNVFMDFGYGRRYAAAAVDLGGVLQAHLAQKDQPGGWPSLGPDGLLPADRLPYALSSSRSVVITSPTVSTLVIWRAQRACEVVGVHAYRTGGASATVNAKVGALDLLALDLSLTVADSWLSGPSVQNEVMDVGDALSVDVRSVSGATSITFQIDYVEA
ncbi:hypothetical protein [Streptomyces sp. NPDC005953]|uniref:hypothetical protein n=1 Tax=Streptomyces sp. NPDC005953 TaxID=3156719 RepID=UPI0033C1CC67